MGSPRSALSCL
nr:fibroblast growth factor FGF-8a [Homo sapiens]